MKDRDLFFETYRKNLAQRLLSQSKQINHDLERTMLSTIKVLII